MKFTPVLAITALMGLSSAAAIEKRDISVSSTTTATASESWSTSGTSSSVVSIDTCSDAYTLVKSVHDQVFSLTGHVNATCSGLSSSSDESILSAALGTVKGELVEITTLVKTAQKQVAKIGSGVELAAGHTVADLSNILSALLVEVEYTANGVIGIFGYWNLYGVLYNLNTALSGLCSGLGGIVSGLLVLVQGTLKVALCGVTGVLGGVLEVLNWVL